MTHALFMSPYSPPSQLPRIKPMRLRECVRIRIHECAMKAVNRTSAGTVQQPLSTLFLSMWSTAVEMSATETPCATLWIRLRGIVFP